MKAFARWAAVAAGLALPLACSPGQDGADLRGDIRTVVDTVGGVEHLRNSGSGLEWRLEQELRLGTLHDGPEAFGRIRSILAGPDGAIYVADNVYSEIRVFAPDGAHRASFGRNGAGPGEFGSLYAIAWVGNRLAAMDPGNARIGLFSPRGEWLDMWQHYPITGGPSLIRLHPDGTSGFYAPVIGSGNGRLPFVRYSADGRGEPTLAHPQPPEGITPAGTLCHTPDGGITGISIPGAPQIVFAFAPEGVRAVSWTERYRIAFLNAEGDTVRVVEHARPPAPFTDEEWERGVRPYHELRERFPGATCEPRAPVRPAAKAALRHILFDTEGRMWVEASTPDGHSWDIFDSDGRLFASVPAPRRQSGVPPYVQGDRLYQVEADPMGLQSVGVYRLTRP